MAAKPFAVTIAQAPPFTYTVDTRGAQATLQRLGAGMRNPRPVVEGMAGRIRSGIHRQFAVGGDPAWVPNRPNTVAAKGGASKPLSGGAGTSGIEKATKVQVGQDGNELSIVTTTSAVGMYHNYGRGVPVGGKKWIIVPVRAAALRFVVAASQGAFRKARRSAQAARRAGANVSVPGRAASLTKVQFAMRVEHPGYPARPFLPVIDEAWIQANWRTPLHDFLFGQYRRAS